MLLLLLLSASAASAAALVSHVVVVVVDLVVLRGRGGGGHGAVVGGRGQAALPLLVEDEHGGAALEARVAALARPVAVAGLAQGNVAVGVILAERWKEGQNEGDNCQLGGGVRRGESFRLSKISTFKKTLFIQSSVLLEKFSLPERRRSLWTKREKKKW